MEVGLPHSLDGKLHHAKVKRWVSDEKDRPTGGAHEPIAWIKRSLGGQLARLHKLINVQGDVRLPCDRRNNRKWKMDDSLLGLTSNDNDEQQKDQKFM